MNKYNISVGDVLTLVGPGWVKGSGHKAKVLGINVIGIITEPCAFTKDTSHWEWLSINNYIEKESITVSRKKSKRLLELVDEQIRNNNDPYKKIYLRT